MLKEQNQKQKALHRIKIIKGHVQAVENMIDHDAYCVDVIHQSRAIQTALKKLDMFILEEHLKSCVVDQIKNNDEARTVAELVRLYEVR